MRKPIEAAIQSEVRTQKYQKCVPDTVDEHQRAENRIPPPQRTDIEQCGHGTYSTAEYAERHRHPVEQAQCPKIGQKQLCCADGDQHSQPSCANTAGRQQCCGDDGRNPAGEDEPHGQKENPDNARHGCGEKKRLPAEQACKQNTR